MSLSVSYYCWSPMEKLMFHLSPVTRRRYIKAQGQQSSAQTQQNNPPSQLPNQSNNCISPSPSILKNYRRTKSEPNDKHSHPPIVGRNSINSPIIGRRKNGGNNRTVISVGNERDLNKVQQQASTVSGSSLRISPPKLGCKCVSCRQSSCDRKNSLSGKVIPLKNDFSAILVGKMREVESELVDKLDILVQENKADESYKLLFDTMLSDIMEQRDLVWKENGKAFISSVSTLLERLLDYRNALQTEDTPRQQRMSCIVNLLNFYRNESNRAADSPPAISTSVHANGNATAITEGVT